MGKPVVPTLIAPFDLRDKVGSWFIPSAHKSALTNDN